MNQTISVIVPVYNVEAYLPACLDSLCDQTCWDLEILVVDDGSTDRSGEICDAYAARDPRIRVVHQKNGGAANAKNTAMKLATGQYLTFADSDDLVEPDAYEYMRDMLQAHQADVIQCAHQKMFRDHELLYTHGPQFLTLSPEEFLRRFTTDWKSGLLWNKLYRRELFSGIFFEEGHKIDDEYFTYQGIMRAKKLLLSPHVVYHYRMRRSSVMASPCSMEQIVLDRLDVLDRRRQQVLRSYPGLKAEYDRHYADSLLALMKEPGSTANSIQQAKKLIRRFLSERPGPRLRTRLKLYLLLTLLKSGARMLEESRKLSAAQEPELYFE